MRLRRLVLAGCVVAALCAASATAAEPPLDVHPICSPAPADCSAWYRVDTTISWVLDAGLMPAAGTCGTQVIIAVETATCAGMKDGTKVVQRWQTVQVDKTAPAMLAPVPDRPPDSGGWYRMPLRVTFGATDAVSAIGLCTTGLYSGPDSAATGVSGTCADAAGNVGASTFPLRYDATPPVIARAVPARKPDHAGWYNHAVVVRFKATDALSGLATCPPVLVAGDPDSKVRPVVATCTDVAGNVSTRTFTLASDVTPPVRPAVSVRTGDRLVRLALQASADTARVQVSRVPGRRGKHRSRLYSGVPRAFADTHVRNGRRYRYTVTAFDVAGNARRTHVAARPGGHLLAPADGALVSAPPLLRWTRARGASYYNVQLFRAGHKVLSAWPARPRLQLKAAWRFDGRKRALLPGRYRWYVWPGTGARAAQRYGRLIGGGSFTVPAAL